MQEIASGVFVETDYDGVNVAAILTEEGVICIDVPSYPRDAREWANRVGRLHGRGPRYLILTGYHGDRLLNTRWLSVPIIASQPTAEKLSAYDKRYPQPLLESLSQRNPQLGRELTSGPVDQAAISFAGQVNLYSGRHTLGLYSRPGPNAGVAWVYWPEAGVLFSGDSVVTETHPPLSDLLLDQWLASLASLIQGQPKVKLIVPGRGQPAGLEAATAMTTYLQLISSLVNQHIAAGRARQDLAGLVPDIIDYFPITGFASEWYQREIAQGLQHVYDQLQTSPGMPLVEQ